MYSCGWRGRMHKCRAACRVFVLWVLSVRVLTKQV